MGLFRKKQQEPAPNDADLPLTVDRAARLRVMVREEFARAGVEVAVAPDHVVDDQGSRFGLWNLAALCAGEPERQWPELVQRHVAGLMAPKQGLEDMSEQQLTRDTYLRLVEADAIPDPAWHEGARRLGEGLLVLPSVDLPDTVTTPQRSAWDAHGGVERWEQVGTANLRSLLHSDDVVHELVRPEGGGDFEVVMGDSFFTASLALLGDELVQRFTPGVDVDRGLLVVVPFRHQLAWRVVDGPDAALALNHLFGFAMNGFSDAPGPLAPHVYWVRRGEWRQVTDLSGDRPAVHVDPELADALGMEG
jgi:hypothetical protein